MAKYQELNPHALGVAFAVIGFVTSLLGFGGGMMGYQYGMMGYAYMNPLSIVFMAVFGYVFGWIAASLYNWALKK